MGDFKNELAGWVNSRAYENDDWWYFEKCQGLVTMCEWFCIKKPTVVIQWYSIRPN